MKELLFAKPIFNPGVNLTVRRGVKWSLETEAVVNGQPVTLTTQVVRFMDLDTDDLELEHDPDCRTYLGLYEEMQRVYPGFHECEIVTLVFFGWLPERRTDP